jgi:hypothetical protein
MVFNNLFRSVLLAASLGLVASVAPAADPATPAPASTPPATETATPAPAAPAQPENATAPNAAKPNSAALTPEAQAEAEAASHLEKKFQEAARSYRKVEKNGKTMYCKKEKPINSTIPRLQCMTESELRLQVEQMDQLRDKMRNQSRCTQGAGCGAGS